MCWCDIVKPTLYNRGNVNGRKEHMCCECLRMIEKGERHEYVSGLWEGDFDAFRTCAGCVLLRESLDSDCFIHGRLMDEVSESDEDTPAMIEFSSRRRENYLKIKAEKNEVASS